MQATRFTDEAESLSGTFPAQPTTDRFEEAYRLACAIERLLTPAEGEAAESYGQRITRGLVRSLIDALQDLQRDSVRSRRIV
jgi:hypothetical protein